MDLFFDVVPPGIEHCLSNNRQNEVAENPGLYSRRHKKETRMDLFFIVVPPGIEPGTQGFSVLCSTN